jgi:iron complex outermembrane receptor protein
MRRTLLLTCSLSAIGLASIGSTAQAQDAAGEQSSQIDDIIVTAQKRSQTLQEVPISVTALSAETIEKARIIDLESVATRTPNFVIGHDGPTTPELTIRGIGSTDREAGSDRSVVVFEDEVYIGRTGASTFDLFDLERVEVLRGPQGSLFGRNVVGGAVHIIRAKPDSDPLVRFQATVGDRHLLEARAVVNGPLAEGLDGRLSISSRRQDGYYFNRVIGRRSNDAEGTSLRGQLRWRPNEATDIILAVEGGSDSVDGLASTVTQGAVSDANFAAALAPYSYTPSSDPYVTDNRQFGSLDRENYAASLRILHDFGPVSMTFLPAYRYTDYSELRDVAGVGFSGTGQAVRGFESTEIVDETYSAFSAELRFASNTDGPLQWVTGIYTLSEAVDRAQIRERQANRAISRPLFDQYNDVTSYAVFANGRWAFSEGFGITVGARYTIDDREFGLEVIDTITPAQRAAIIAQVGQAPSLSPAAAVFATVQSKTFERFTPEISADWQVTEDILLFGKVGTGFKSGGFVGLGATRADAERSFDPETVVNYELGAKTQFFDNRLQANLSAFFMQFEDLQLRDRVLLIPGDETSAVVTIQNAAQAEIKGLEAELQAKPIAALQLSGSIAFLDSQITETRPGSTIRLGTALPRSPEFSTTVAAEYTFFDAFSGAGDLSVRGEVVHTGEFYFDINEPPSTFEASRTLVNARIGYKPANGDWEVAVWGKNLTDETYRSFGRTSLADRIALTQVGEPLSFGITLTKSWGR